jgi:hypothetical protein
MFGRVERGASAAKEADFEKVRQKEGSPAPPKRAGNASTGESYRRAGEGQGVS